MLPIFERKFEKNGLHGSESCSGARVFHAHDLPSMFVEQQTVPTLLLRENPPQVTAKPVQRALHVFVGRAGAVQTITFLVNMLTAFGDR